jgi:hypothetical protein
MIRRTLTAISLLATAMVVASVGASLAFAETETTSTSPATEVSSSPVSTTTVPAPPTPPVEAPPSTAPSTPTAPPATGAPTAEGETTTTVPAPPEVQTQSTQPRTTAPRRSVKGKALSRQQQQGKTGGHAGEEPVSPSALTPPLPSALNGSIVGVPSFFIDSFSIPPFLLPIYQAAGAAYGIPWQVLAAINEVETDYGRDLNVSSAGAEGWMQFMPSTWGQYGVDVNNDGFEDPYNPADAIFGAARYLKAAGGDSDIRGAIFAYNHSQAYVNSVLLRARLLGGTPPELLGAITGLTEARFPVYAASHYSDGFPVSEGASPHTVAGTTIYSQADAPIIAVQDGRITDISESGSFGRSISLQDAYGNTYTYSDLGTLATLYPVLEASEAEAAAANATRTTPDAGGAASETGAAQGATRMFRAGSEKVYLHPLKVGAQVIAGTVLGHLGSDVQPHMVFQIRPAGTGAPAIDPKPILDGWVKLESTSVEKAKGPDPFATVTPSPGQTLLETKVQLEHQIQGDDSVQMPSCVRHMVAEGSLDRRVLATLEFLSVSGLKPTVSSSSCALASTAVVKGPENTVESSVDISAVNGLPVLEPGGSTTPAGTAIRKLHHLQGVMKPLQISAPTASVGANAAASAQADSGSIHISFTPLGGETTHSSTGLFNNPGLSPAQWIKLIARLGQIPDPAVSSKPSPAAIPDQAEAAAHTAGAGN